MTYSKERQCYFKVACTLLNPNGLASILSANHFSTTNIIRFISFFLVGIKINLKCGKSIYNANKINRIVFNELKYNFIVKMYLYISKLGCSGFFPLEPCPIKTNISIRLLFSLKYRYLCIFIYNY